MVSRQKLLSTSTQCCEAATLVQSGVSQFEKGHRERADSREGEISSPAKRRLREDLGVDYNYLKRG